MSIQALLKDADEDDYGWVTHTCANCRTEGAKPVYCDTEAYGSCYKSVKYSHFSCEECTFKCPNINCPYVIKSKSIEGMHGSPVCECGWKVPIRLAWRGCGGDDSFVGIYTSQEDLTYLDCYDFKASLKRSVDRGVVTYEWVDV